MMKSYHSTTVPIALANAMAPIGCGRPVGAGVMLVLVVVMSRLAAGPSRGGWGAIECRDRSPYGHAGKSDARRLGVPAPCVRKVCLHPVFGKRPSNPAGHMPARGAASFMPGNG